MPINLCRAADLMSLIAKARLPVHDQHDVATYDCPIIGCTDKVDSATVSVSTFPTTGGAEGRERRHQPRRCGSGIACTTRVISARRAVTYRPPRAHGVKLHYELTA